MTAHLAHATRASIPHPPPHAIRDAIPCYLLPTILLPLVVCNSRFLYPPFAPYHIQTKRPRTLTYHQIVHIHPQALVHTAPTQPNTRPLYRVPPPPTKLSAHKRPVDRPVGLRVCRRRYRRRPLADVPKERAAIQLPESKRPFPKRRAAWGWLPAAAFYPANPQPEASAGFLVPFSKKGTSYM